MLWAVMGSCYEGSSLAQQKFRGFFMFYPKQTKKQKHTHTHTQKYDLIFAICFLNIQLHTPLILEFALQTNFPLKLYNWGSIKDNP